MVCFSCFAACAKPLLWELQPWAIQESRLGKVMMVSLDRQAKRETERQREGRNTTERQTEERQTEERQRNEKWERQIEETERQEAEIGEKLQRKNKRER